MKYIFCSLVIFFSQISGAYTQQCGFKNHGAILVKVIDEQTGQPIRGLNMQLVYGNGSPIEELGTIDANNPKERALWVEPYVFWENNGGKIPQQKAYDIRVFRQEFPRAGDHYICVVPTLNGLNAKSLFVNQAGNYFFALPWTQMAHVDTKNNGYYVELKIEDTDGANNGGLYAGQQFRIPIAAVTDICKNNLYKPKGLSSDAEKLNPIEVVLRANDTNFKAIIHHSSFDKYPIPYYRAMSLSEEGTSAFECERIELHDEATGSILQTLFTFSESKFRTKGEIEFGDFYRDGFTPVRHFRVPAMDRHSTKRSENCFLYYRWNYSTQLYEEDTLLNNKQETFFNRETRLMLAKDLVEHDTEMVFYQYALNNKEWQLVKTDRHPKPKPIEQPTIVAKANCYIVHPRRDLPVQYFDRGHEKTIVDTLWILNVGNKKAQLKSTSFYFKVPQEIGPQERLPIVYERKFIGANRFGNNYMEVNGSMQFLRDSLEISFVDGPPITASINYLILNHQADIQKLEGAGAAFTIPVSKDRCKKVITNSAGYLYEYGDYFLPSWSRIGQWIQIDSTEKDQQKIVQCHKLFHLQIANADIKECYVTVFNKWSAADYKREFPGLISISPMISSILVKKDSASAMYSIDFNAMKQEDGVTLYLLKPNEDFFYRGQIKYPINMQHQQYKVLFEPVYRIFQERPKSIPNMDWEKNYMNTILEKYPNLKYYNLGRQETKGASANAADFMVLDLAACSAKERSKILKALENDSNIQSVCKLFNPDAYQFCDWNIIIRDKKNQPLDPALIRRARELGFEYTGMQTLNAQQQFTFSYRSKIVDEVFFEAFNQLCSAHNLLPIDLNIYALNVQESGFQQEVDGIELK
ncbi:MAG: hypothetical protein ACOYLG_09325 [Chitinophagaceae bacterium]